LRASTSGVSWLKNSTLAGSGWFFGVVQIKIDETFCNGEQIVLLLRRFFSALVSTKLIVREIAFKSSLIIKISFPILWLLWWLISATRVESTSLIESSFLLRWLIKVFIPKE